jgi:hypothetical protein
MEDWQGNPNFLTWATQNLPFQVSEETNRALLKVGVPASMLTWMKNNGIPFPEDFEKIVKKSRHPQMMFWLIEQKLSPGLRGIWREVIEEWKLRGHHDEVRSWLLEELKKVLQDPGRCPDLVEKIRVRRKSTTRKVRLNSSPFLLK